MSMISVSSSTAMKISHFSLPDLLFLTFAVLVVIAFCIIIQRIFFHTLSRFPGPFFAKFTDMYAAYHGFIGDVHLDAELCHQKYVTQIGKLVRYGPNRLLVNSHQGMNDIYGHLKNVQKSRTYLPMVPGNDGWSTLTTIDKAKHRFKRRLISAELGEVNLQGFQKKMLHHINTFCKQLGEGSSKDRYSGPKNMIDWCEFLTMDIIGDFGFGQKLDMLTSTTNRFIMNTLHNYSWTMGFYEQMPSLAKLRFDNLVRWLLSPLASQKRWTAWSQRFAAAVLTPSSPKSSGIFAAILAAKEPNGLPTKRSELWAEGSFLMLAGSDTSATTMASLFFYLSHSEDAYEKLATEIRTTFSHASDIQMGSKLLSCKYLHACITEAMRISPSTPGIPYREVLSDGLLVDGLSMPPGIDVGSCIYALHHNPLYFGDPGTYIPERWLHCVDTHKNDNGDIYTTVASTSSNADDTPSPEQEQEQATLARQYAAYSPFSIGPRSCPGRGFALMEISLTLAKVLWHLDFKLTGDDVDGRLGEGRIGAKGGRGRVGEYQLKTHVTASSEGPVLRFKKRRHDDCWEETAVVVGDGKA